MQAAVAMSILQGGPRFASQQGRFVWLYVTPTWASRWHLNQTKATSDNTQHEET